MHGIPFVHCCSPSNMHAASLQGMVQEPGKKVQPLTQTPLATNIQVVLA